MMKCNTCGQSIPLPEPVDLPSRFKYARLMRGMTQEAVGGRRQECYEIESGRRENLQIQTIQRYADRLKVSPAWLAFGIGEMERGQDTLP